MTAKENTEVYVWKDPLMEEIITQAGQDEEYKQVADLVKMRRDKSFIKTKLETQHPARQYIQVWDRLGYEEDKVTGNILIILDDTRIVIPRGVDESGQVTGQMRRKISKLLHVPHLGEVKTARAAERRYY